MAEQNYYELFGLARSADIAQIKREYRKFSQKFHPDKNADDAVWATGKMKKINEAWSTLSEPEKKKAYDADLDWKEQLEDKARQNAKREATQRKHAKEEAEKEKEKEKHARQRTEHARQQESDQSRKQAEDRAETFRSSQRQKARRQAAREEMLRRQKIDEDWENRFGGMEAATGTAQTLSANSFHVSKVLPWIIYIFMASILIFQFYGDPAQRPHVPAQTDLTTTKTTPGLTQPSVLAIESARATVVREIQEANWESYLPHIRDIERRFPVLLTEAGKPTMLQLIGSIESKRIQLNHAVTVTKRSNDKDAVRTTKPLPRKVDVEKKMYDETLRAIESLHTELNPDHSNYRKDLIIQAAKRIAVYEDQGMVKHDALKQAVSDMESAGAFTPMVKVSPKKTIEAGSAVLDPGGHPGFDPKCRWLSAQEWSCK